jgi:hypothetical protein
MASFWQHRFCSQKTASPVGDSTRQVCTWSPAPLERRDLVVEVGKCPDELEGEELFLEARRVPYLEELAGGNGDAGLAGAEGHGFHSVLEGDPVEIHEEAPPVSIDDQEEHAKDSLIQRLRKKNRGSSGRSMKVSTLGCRSTKR